MSGLSGDPRFDPVDPEPLHRERVRFHGEDSSIRKKADRKGQLGRQRPEVCTVGREDIGRGRFRTRPTAAYPASTVEIEE
jgi:hypothetical protein